MGVFQTQFLCSSSICSSLGNVLLYLFYPLSYNNTMRVSIFHFPPILKLSNLCIKLYLLALTIINAFYLLWTRADHSRSFYIIQVCLHLMNSLMFSRHFQNLCLALFQLSFISALAHLRCSCITYRGNL